MINKDRPPLHLVVVTPDVDAKGLPAFAKDHPLPGALWAHDPRNVEKISLHNTLQVALIKATGEPSSLGFKGIPDHLKPLLGTPALGKHRYPPDGLTDPKVKDLWWLVECGEPGAVKALVAASKRSGPQQDELRKLADAVTTAGTAQEDLLCAGNDLATYEGLERLLAESQGLELKKAPARFRELGADKAVKAELEARSMYRKCNEAAASPKADMQKAAKDGFAQVAKKFPDTVYGRKAAARS